MVGVPGAAEIGDGGAEALWGVEAQQASLDPVLVGEGVDVVEQRGVQAPFRLWAVLVGGGGGSQRRVGAW